MIYPSLVLGSAPADAVRDLLHDDEGDRLRGHRELRRAVHRLSVERGQLTVGGSQNVFCINAGARVCLIARL